MAHGQALDAQRAPAFSFDPAELTLVTYHRDPLFDPRVERCAVPRERVLDIAMRGVHTPIQVRRRGSENVVIAGKQRTKAALVCNAIGAGVKYTGNVQRVHEAIAEFSKDEDLVKKVTAWMRGKAIRIRAVAANSGDESAARMLMRSENAQRLDDAKADRIRDVQEALEKYGDSVEDLAIAHGVSEGTIRRWAKADLSAERKPKARGKATRPSAKRVADIAALAVGARDVPHAVNVALGWVAGSVPEADFFDTFPSLAPAAKKTKAA